MSNAGADPARRRVTGVLPTHARGPQMSWWGTLVGLIAVGMLQAAPLFAYAFLGARSDAWPPVGVGRPALGWPTIATVLLLAGGLAATAARMAAGRGRPSALQAGSAVAALLGSAHLGVQIDLGTPWWE